MTKIKRSCSTIYKQSINEYLKEMLLNVMTGEPIRIEDRMKLQSHFVYCPELIEYAKKRFNVHYKATAAKLALAGIEKDLPKECPYSFCEVVYGADRWLIRGEK